MVKADYKALILKQAAVLAAGVMGVIAIRFADMLLPLWFESISIYLIPVVFVTWFANRTCGFILCGLSIAAWFTLAHFDEPSHTAALIVLDTVMKSGVLAAAVILIASLRKSLAREKALSRLDELTGLFNRRSFLQLLDAERARALRYRTTLSIAFIDVDDFKLINDRFGHHAGDRALTGIGQVLQRNTRATDMCARLGGDEFVVLLIHTDGENAKRVVNKLFMKLRARLSRWKATVSVGVATFAEPGTSSAALLTCADGLMYKAKRNGKNAINFKTFKRPVLRTRKAGA